MENVRYQRIEYVRILAIFQNDTVDSSHRPACGLVASGTSDCDEAVRLEAVRRKKRVAESGHYERQTEHDDEADDEDGEADSDL